MFEIIFCVAIPLIWLLSVFAIDFIELFIFKNMLKKCSLLYPSFSIFIPTKLKELSKFKRDLEEFNFDMGVLLFTHRIANMPIIYGEAIERKNDEEL